MADITPIASLNGELAMPEKVWMQGPPGPQGQQGEPGAAATVTVGTVTTGEPGTDAIVTNSGTESAAVLNFAIPRGETGAVGAVGPRGPKGDTGETGPAGAGVPDGGTVGQLLGKTETGTSWIDPPQSGGGSDDVYLIKHITNYDTGTEEWQGDYNGALAAHESGKKVKFVEAGFDGLEEWVDFESFDYYFSQMNSFFRFVGYYDDNFVTYKLTESGVTGGNRETHIGSLYVDIPKAFFLRSASGKQFRVIVSNTGELSTEEVR